MILAFIKALLFPLLASVNVRQILQQKNTNSVRFGICYENKGALYNEKENSPFCVILQLIFPKNIKREKIEDN